jgi:DNA-binding beta-propeller fold protein YncE
MIGWNAAGTVGRVPGLAIELDGIVVAVDAEGFVIQQVGRGGADAPRARVNLANPEVVVGDRVEVEGTTALALFGGPFSGLTGPRGNFELRVDPDRIETISSDNPLPEGDVLAVLDSYASSAGAEISAFDPGSDRLFVTTGQTIEVLDASDPANLTLEEVIDVTAIGPSVQSVATAGGLLAAAIDGGPGVPGTVAIFDAATLDLVDTAEVGFLPDQLGFDKSGRTLVVANEGEPTTAGDPAGSISRVKLGFDGRVLDVTTFGFEAFDGRVDELRSEGVRIFPGKLPSVDFEPEYVAVAPDGRTALATLQEANAVALLDLVRGRVVDVIGLGGKDHGLAGNGLDPSDKDGGIEIGNWPVFGLYQPDAIAAFEVRGKTYYAIANEGDTRGEEARISTLVLDPTAFPNATALKNNAALGRLDASTIDGDLDGDTDFDQLFVYGGRSFSILDARGQMIFDSGDQLERITALEVPAKFNSNGSASTFDTRSDNKGPEPEGLTIGTVDGKPFLFLGLERTGGVLAYDLSDPFAPQFVQYLDNPGDVSPEGLLFVDGRDSPTGDPLLVVSNEVSNTVTVYDVASSGGGPLFPLLAPALDQPVA